MGSKGQPLSHIFANHLEDIPCSIRTIYRYVDLGYLSVKNIDMRRIVRYKPRKKTAISRANPQKKIGHTYEHFMEFTAKNPDSRIVEMDLVEGTKGGKVLLTLFMRDTSLMLAYLLENKEMLSVVSVLDQIERTLGSEEFCRVFPVLLTDNGNEFANPELFEYGIAGEKRATIYYCEPRQSNQKGRLEKNHEYIRYILPKGTSFDGLSQEDVTLMTNHINSTARPGLGSKTPIELAQRSIPPGTLKKLGVSLIEPDKVCLTKDLFKEG